MFQSISKFMMTGPNKPLMAGDQGQIATAFNKIRWQVFTSITLGYALFYVLRLSFSVIKKPLMAAGVLDAQQIGVMGSVFFATYGIGKFTNSFLADRMNNKRFFAMGLFMSSIISVSMGFVNSYVPLVVLWGLNGWFQSYGAGPCIVSLNHWFSNRERGTFYGVWFTSHNLGAAFTYMATAAIVGAYSWQMGFIMPGIVCMFGSFIIYFFMSDRPETRGLPNVADFKNDHAEIVEKDKSVGALQWEVVKRPAVWILGFSSLFCYIARYAIESWGIIYLTEAKAYTTMGASGVLSVMQFAGIFGALTCGLVSDKFFNHRRNMPALIYGVLYALSIAAFVWAPANKWIDMGSMVVYGFTMGALVCYLGGLMAVDICPKRATGAAMGMIGLLSYGGAAAQELISGYLIKSHMTIVNGKKIYDFALAADFWVASAVISFLLAACVWNVKAKD